MTALVLFLLVAWIVTAAGRQIVTWLRLPGDATVLERSLIGFALGLGALSYGLLLLGLLGGLRLPFAIGWLLLLALLGGRQHLVSVRELMASAPIIARLRGMGWGVALLFLVFAAVSLVGVYTPPTVSLEWDSLAYHLADPKMYVQAHRIYYLPWESHSNFAFTAEMWYTLGLLFHSIPLAKWFHFPCGVGTCLAAYAFGARHLTPRVGVWAALLLAATPLVFWEAGVAYADLATTFFATLTLLAVANGMRDREERWLWVGAVLMGLTLSTKATALTTLGLLGLGLLFWRLRVLQQEPLLAVRQVVLWGLLALAVGSPWYIKSAVYTGNPVYPFYSQLFGGRYWNAENARAYDQSNADFGVGRSPDKWLLSPWNLTMNPLPGHPIDPMHKKQAFNDYQTPLMSVSPVLLAALFFPAFRRKAAPPVVSALGLYALGGWLFWFATAQHVRYLLPLLPVLCLLTAWVLIEALAVRRASGYALIGLAGCSVLFSLYVGASLVSMEAPVALGQVTAEQYLIAHDTTYPAMQFINTQLPANTKLVFYGNPLGFYCDRPYLWGESGHSLFIPYGRFRSAADLRQYLAGMGVTHILVNTSPAYFPFHPGPGYAGWVYDLTAGASPPLFEQHGVAVYALPPAQGGH